MLEAESAEEVVIEKLEEEQEEREEVELELLDGESFFEREQEGEAAVDRRRSTPSSAGSLAITPPVSTPVPATGIGIGRSITSANANIKANSNQRTVSNLGSPLGSPLGTNPSPMDTTPQGLATEIIQIFGQTLQDILKQGGPAALFTGAVPRLLFFAPAGMIFFATYEGVFEILAVLQKNNV